MDERLTVGSLFSGIGGFDLGFERAGMRTVWFCEQDPFCQRVLAQHWPGVPVYPDVRSLVADTADAVRRTHVGSVEGLQAAGEAAPHGRALCEGNRSAGPNGSATSGGTRTGGGPLPVSVPYVDVLCGGFPCQDISVAGRGEGIDGARSGLWAEYARLIRDLRPRYVVVENVAALLARGMERVLGDLAACGYDAEWDCVPASAVGAPHRRDRVWLVAYPQRDDGRQGWPWRPDPSGARQSVSVRTLQNVADTGGAGRWQDSGGSSRHEGADEGRATQHHHLTGRDGQVDGGWWESEPDVGRVAHGIPARVDRLRSLGNALVPQIAQWIGERIVIDAAFDAETAA